MSLRVSGQDLDIGESVRVHAVYRRSDGHIGWIDPPEPAGGLAERA